MSIKLINGTTLEAVYTHTSNLIKIIIVILELVVTLLNIYINKKIGVLCLYENTG